MNKLNINKMLQDFQSFDEHLNEELKNQEFEREFLDFAYLIMQKTGIMLTFLKI